MLLLYILLNIIQLRVILLSFIVTIVLLFIIHCKFEYHVTYFTFVIGLDWMNWMNFTRAITEWCDIV